MAALCSPELAELYHFFGLMGLELESAEQHGLFDLERLEKMVLKGIAKEYFVIPFDLTPPKTHDE